jgi:monoamine oxidase
MKHLLATQLRAIFQKALKDTQVEFTDSRRSFLKNTALMGGAAAIGGLPRLNSPDFLQKARIAVVGGGMAGLNAAYLLRRAGLLSTVYEASNRVGGRMMSSKNAAGFGLSTDLGGEFVDGNHDDILSLLREFNLPYFDLRKDTPNLSKVLFFGGKMRSSEEYSQALKPFVKKMANDMLNLPRKLDDLSFRDSTKWAYLDQMSIPAYLKSLGMNGWLLNCLCGIMSSIYTMPAEQQSAINLFLIFGNEPSEPKPENTEDKEHSSSESQSEIFKIIGGSQTLTDRLAKKIDGQIKKNHVLMEIQKDNSRYVLSFEENGQVSKVVADYVILTLPFTALRKVKTVGFEWSDKKGQAIRELGYGNGGKCVFGVNERFWRKNGLNGGFSSELNAPGGWDSSRMQGGSLGSLTVFGGGTFGEKVATLSRADLEAYLVPDLEKIFPGFKGQLNGKMLNFSWQAYPYNLGSYTSYKVGQWSQFGGVEKEPEGNLYFAGEHCDIFFQGYMNGAARTGRLAAEAVVGKVKTSR